MLNVVDKYCWDDDYKILTPAQTGVPALRTFGLDARRHASQPLTPHIHQNCMEIVFLLSGFQVYEAAGASFSLSGYDIFVSYPNEPHSSDGCLNNVCNVIWMQIDLSPDLPLLGLSKERSRQLRQSLLNLPRISGGDDALRRMLTDAFFALAGQNEFERFCGEQLLVCALQRIVKNAVQPSPNHSGRIGDALEYIRDHLGETLPLEDVAAASGLSLSRFKTCFKAETGITPREYINQLKIRQAARMLAEGVSVTETAMALGFTTPNYFSVLFRKYTCQSPSQYIRSLQRRQPQ